MPDSPFMLAVVLHIESEARAGLRGGASTTKTALTRCGNIRPGVRQGPWRLLRPGVLLPRPTTGGSSRRGGPCFRVPCVGPAPDSAQGRCSLGAGTAGILFEGHSPHVVHSTLHCPVITGMGRSTPQVKPDGCPEGNRPAQVPKGCTTSTPAGPINKESSVNPKDIDWLDCGGFDIVDLRFIFLSGGVSGFSASQ